jgi:hypothetical protein
LEVAMKEKAARVISLFAIAVLILFLLSSVQWE